MSGWRPKYAAALPYFDAANHAKRIKCETSILGGLGDYVCPPSGIVVLYNNINAPKTLKLHQGREHGHVPEEKTEITIFTNKKLNNRCRSHAIH